MRQRQDLPGKTQRRVGGQRIGVLDKPEEVQHMRTLRRLRLPLTGAAQQAHGTLPDRQTADQMLVRAGFPTRYIAAEASPVHFSLNASFQNSREYGKMPTVA